METTSTNLGTVLRRLREEKGFSLRDMERQTGVLLGAIGAIERGETRGPSVIVVAKVCLALGVTVDQVLEDAGLIPTTGERRQHQCATSADIDRVFSELSALRKMLEDENDR